MHTPLTFHRFEWPVYGLVLLLMLASALVGAAGGYAFSLPTSASPAVPASQQIPQAAPVQVVATNTVSDPNEAWQEHLAIRQAQREWAAARSASTQMVEAAPGPQEAWQEHQAIRQAQREWAAARSASTPSPIVEAAPGPNELWQEHLAIRQAQREWTVARSASAPTLIVQAVQGPNETWQEHLLLRQMQNSRRPVELAPIGTNNPPPTTAEGYPRLSERKIKQLEDVP